MRQVLWLALLCAPLVAQNRTSKTFDIYFIDVEGGHATLYVAPTGESLLEDTGNPGTRDADRIMAAADAAGVKQIDHLILTHYHVDHIGGLQELAKRIPIKHFIDHGPSVEPREQVQGFQQMYAELYSKERHTVAKPGDKIPFGGVDVTVVTAAHQVIKTPLPGAGKPNPACAEFKKQDPFVDGGPENTQSVGVVYTYGKFKHINLGDYTWDAEAELMCPNNPIGKVDLYITSHHGIDYSGSPALVHGLRPTVAIMHNGTRKGGTVQTMRMLYTSPGLQDVWQLHWAYSGGLEYNSPGLFIANLEDPAAIAAFLTNPDSAGRMFGAPPPAGASPAGPPPAGAPAAPAAGAPAAPPANSQAQGGPPAGRGPGGGGGFGGGFGGGRGGGHTGPAYWIKVSAQQDGTFTVTNTRNNFSKTYAHYD